MTFLILSLHLLLTLKYLYIVLRITFTRMYSLKKRTLKYTMLSLCSTKAIWTCGMGLTFFRDILHMTPRCTLSSEKNLFTVWVPYSDKMRKKDCGQKGRKMTPFSWVDSQKISSEGGDSIHFMPNDIQQICVKAQSIMKTKALQLLCCHYFKSIFMWKCWI